MSVPFLKKYNGLLPFLLVLMFFLSINAVIIVQDHNNDLSDAYHKHLQSELELMVDVVHENVLRHDLSTIEKFLGDWAKKHPEIIEITLTAANGFVMFDYRGNRNDYRDRTPHIGTLDYDGKELFKLTVKHDWANIELQTRELSFKVAIIIVVLSAIMGAALWLVLRYSAVLPVEREVARRQQVEEELAEANDRLESRVEERTRELTKEIDERHKSEMRANIANRAKTDMLANMSHELRTPLNAIIGFSSTMELETFGPLSKKYLEYAKDIHGSGEHLLELINDILDVSAVEAGKLELDEKNLDVGEVFAASLQMVNDRAIKGNVHLIRKTDNGLPKLCADKRRLMQILINLLSNAIKFTPPDGKVVLASSLDGENAHVLTVRDTGIGMDEEELAKAMSDFGQVDSGLDRKHEGTGLGLPLTQGLIDLHGGMLEIESEKGVGTTVTVRFPSERTLLS